MRREAGVFLTRQGDVVQVMRMAIDVLARFYAHGKGASLSLGHAAEWYEKVLTFDGQVDDQGEMDEARTFLQRHRAP